MQLRTAVCNLLCVIKSQRKTATLQELGEVCVLVRGEIINKSHDERRVEMKKLEGREDKVDVQVNEGYQ